MLFKKLAFAFLVCGCLPHVFAQSPRYDTIRYAKEHYVERLNTFSSEFVRKGEVIFLGNSLTEYADWISLLNDSNVINRGIAGDNSFGVIDRLNDVISLAPSKLFVEIGINDISQNIPLALIEKNIIKIITSVHSKAPKTSIWVMSILPTNDNVKKSYPDTFGKNDQANKVNDYLKNHAKENRFVYLDLNARVKDLDKKLDVRYAMPDGIHLNDEGYAIWIKLLKEKKCI